MSGPGPNLNMADIRPSGTDINTMVTTPATISFNITNDEVAIEVDEVYPVVIIPNNPNVTVEQRVANIIIRDDVDSKSCRNTYCVFIFFTFLYM